MGEVTRSSVDNWTDKRTGWTGPISHNASRMFELVEGFVDVRYGAVFLPTGELIVESTVWDPLRFLLSSPRRPYGGNSDFAEGYSVVPASSYYHFMLEDLPRLSWTLRAFPGRGLVVGKHADFFANEVAQNLAGEAVYTNADFLWVRNYPFVSFGSESGWPCRTSVDVVNATMRELFSPQDRKDSLKVYISRAGHSRAPINEHEVAELAQDHGYECVDASTLTVESQVRLFGQASHLAGVHGAGLTNLLWMKRGRKVVEVLDPGYYNPCYQWLSQIQGLEHFTVVNSSETPGMVDLDGLAAVL